MTCSIEGCEAPKVAKGLCNRHYLRQRNHGSPNVVQIITTCRMDRCERPHHGLGLCVLHYQRWYECGDPFFDGQTFPVCKIEGCLGEVKGRGYCTTHYHKLHKYGDPLGQADPNMVIPMGEDLPLEPLLRAIERHDGLASAFARVGIYEPKQRDRIEKMIDRAEERGAVDVAVADHLCCVLLHTHPALLWGENWWTPEISETEELVAA